MFNDTLFRPLALGAITLPNRIVMAPMTRSRATADGLATPLMASYYAQRAGAGLIVAEMTHVAAEGRGYANVPGIHTVAQARAWREVTQAVHEAGGRIVLQLAHAGRISHPSLLPGGATPVAPSAIRPHGTVHTASGPQPMVTPRALARGELRDVVAQFADAALLARAAGFDGVEVHAGNGYLLDQFLRDGSNRRTDDYGGRVENRARLLLEVVEAVSGAWGAERVGVRLSPFNPFNDMRDSDPVGTFAAVARLLSGRGLAYLHVVEPIAGGLPPARLTPALRRRFHGPVIANEGHDARTARAALARGEADAVSFGAAFIANPDLTHRIAAGAALAAPDRATFYAGGAAGYTDYAPLDAAA